MTAPLVAPQNKQTLKARYYYARAFFYWWQIASFSGM